MNITPKLGLRKPEDSDSYNVADFNYNMDILDDLGGGGGSGVQVTELLDTPFIGGAPGTASDTIELNDSMTNYDMLEFRVGITVNGINQFFTVTALVDDIYDSPTDALFVSGTVVADKEYSVFYQLVYDDDTHLTIIGAETVGWSETRTIFGIKGIKWG